MRPLLTQRQAEVLAFIKEHQLLHGFGPSVRDIAAAIGVSSTFAAYGHLTALKDKGYISGASKRARSFVIVPAEERQLQLF